MTCATCIQQPHEAPRGGVAVVNFGIDCRQLSIQVLSCRSYVRRQIARFSPSSWGKKSPRSTITTMMDSGAKVKSSLDSVWSPLFVRCLMVSLILIHGPQGATSLGGGEGQIIVLLYVQPLPHDRFWGWSQTILAVDGFCVNLFSPPPIVLHFRVSLIYMGHGVVVRGPIIVSFYVQPLPHDGFWGEFK